MVNTLAKLLGREVESELDLERELPRSVVTHDSLDDLALDNMLERSVRFSDSTGKAPRVPPSVEEPEPIDITTASEQDIAEYQARAREAKAAREQAPEWNAWGELRDDLFRSLHTHDTPEIVEEVDPGVDLHKRVMETIIAQDEHAETRYVTRDDEVASALGTMALTEKVREVCTEELGEQMREQQELEDLREEMEELQPQIEGAQPSEGQTLSPKQQQQLERLQSQQQQAEARAQEIAQAPTPMSLGAVEGLQQAAEEGREAAEAAKAMPHFGAGFGAGEPTYTSPEQALTIARQWAENKDLRAMAELFGRLDKDIRFKRSKRIVGGQDEIVDVRMGDDLKRVIPAEMGLLAAGGGAETDFLVRYVDKQLLEYQTVGEEHAGRGPILQVLDGSGSMSGERNVWARAVAMCLLHIARLEKRDFALVEFSSGGQVEEWLFKAKDPMPGQKVLDMASHFFGGGTSPIIGVDRAAKIMRESAAFSKADLVLVGDGDAGFGPEDKRLRDDLHAMGVRIFAIGIGGSFGYLKQYTEPDGYLVDVHDFQLSDPSAATAELATHIT